MTARETSSFVSRVLMTIGLVVLAGLTVYLLGNLIEVLLVVFAAVMVAVAITGVRCIIHRLTPLSQGWSMVATYFLVLALMAGAVAVIWPQLAEQIPKFSDQVPEALDKIRQLADQAPWAAEVIELVETAESSIIYPLATKKAVHVAPAYTVIIQLAGGVVAGIPGVILATPLAVVAAVTIQLLYVEDVLGEKVEILGD